MSYSRMRRSQQIQPIKFSEFLGIVVSSISIINFILNLGQTKNGEIMRYLQNETQKDLDEIRDKLDNLKKE